MGILRDESLRHWQSQFGLVLVCLGLIFALHSGYSLCLPKSHPLWDVGFGAVLTDREKADLLRGPIAEPEDHFGDVLYFKRYILSQPRRIA